MEKRTFSVKKSDEGKRLDIYLSLNNNDLSRSYIKNQIESDKVYVNDKIQYKANYSVKEEDEIVLNINQNRNKRFAPKPQNIELDIIYEDNDLIAINKPTGMVVHPSSGHYDSTLVNALLYKYRNIRTVGNSTRSGLIHRLDKDTSGVILIAKTNRALYHYSKQFSERLVKKQYLAISISSLNSVFNNTTVVDVQNHIGRNPANRKKYIVVDSGGRFAHSSIRFLAQKGKFKLFQIKILTGRTHQIRVHMSNLGMPILGDVIYGRGNIYKRLMLHSWKITINNMKGELITFRADAPVEFIEIFPELKEANDY